MVSARAWAAFAAVSVLWGMPYLFIRVAVDGGMPPIFLAWLRISLAAVITYVAPVLAVGLGMAALGERPGAGAFGGLAAILAGSWLATGGRLPGRRRAAVAAAERSAIVER